MSAMPHPSLRVAFRTDASIQIGTGHVMRCLTLADALAERGAECLFISRAHEGNLNALIETRGHALLELSAGQAAAAEGGNPAHEHWLGISWQEDAQQTLLAFDGTMVDWLVIDHYALDVHWETALRPACRRLMVIDDLADRSHVCDLLLDQNLGRRRADYLDLIPRACSLLAGPKYALLRPEFAALRDESLARRSDGTLEHLLITLGGVDKDNVTGKVLEALATWHDRLPAPLRVSVIMGPRAPWRGHVQEQAERMPWPTQVAVGVTDMARRMADADLIIGAAGTTSWERCCLGVPSVQVVLAGNQKTIAQRLVEAGAAITLPSDAIAYGLRSLFADENLADRMTRLSLAAGAIVDGRGTQRVAEKLLEDLQ